MDVIKINTVIIIGLMALFGWQSLGFMLPFGSSGEGNGNGGDGISAAPLPQGQNSSLSPGSGVQTVQLTINGGVYSPQIIRTRVGQRVRIEADPNAFVGCMRTLVIHGLNVTKRISAGDNIVEFTPTKAGQYRISCSMGMGNGLLIVEDEAGSIPTESPGPTGGSAGGGCGLGGGCGGCGCGGS
ncbi:MAG: cupredoxin domain-containing protein [Candidatus Bilamarchaeaceae archaeon]